MKKFFITLLCIVAAIALIALGFFIANEINKEQQYNWREFDFKENIVSMLNKFKDI